MERKLPNFKFVPALSEPDPTDEWEGQTGLITYVVVRHEDDLSETEAYLAGPPPMIDAAIPVLEKLGVDEEHVYFDKFTTTGEAEGSEKKEVKGPQFPGAAR